MYSQHSLKREGQVYDQNTPHRFSAGYDSHIRGTGSKYVPHHVFPGTQMAGNESGANAPLYAQNPDIGNIVEVDRRHAGGHPWHRVYPAAAFP